VNESLDFASIQPIMGPLLAVVYGCVTQDSLLLCAGVKSQLLLSGAAISCGFILTMCIFGHVKRPFCLRFSGENH
jgi:hypothetical protein